MTDDMITLRELLEKGSDATLLREMIGFAAHRLGDRGAVWGRSWRAQREVTAAIYARVSTEQQTRGNTVASQLALLRDRAEADTRFDWSPIIPSSMKDIA